jgi:poly(A) polymerase
MPLLPLATLIVQRLQKAGFIAYFAGGWVRDFLMQHPSDDIDIATDASIEQIRELFPKTIPVGVNFGILIVVEEGHSFEVATFRKERGYVDGRRPTIIEKATAEEDAQRRDFTINGMFYDPIRKKLFDFVGGAQDIERKCIRAIGNPYERFQEDRLRMMRGVRYAARFQFTIEAQTLQAIKTLSPTLLPSVAFERIWQEFQKMAQFASFKKALIMLGELGLLSTIFPELRTLTLSDLKKRLEVLDLFPPHTPPIAQLLELFPFESLEELEKLCDTLKLSNKDRDLARFLHSAKALLNLPPPWLDHLEALEWAHFYSNPLSEIALDIFAAHKGPERALFLSLHRDNRQKLHKAIARIVNQTPLLSAKQLLQEGIKPSPLLGKLLQEAERIAVNESLEDSEILLQRLKKGPLWPSSS